jgi:hypothetical protein
MSPAKVFATLTGVAVIVPSLITLAIPQQPGNGIFDRGPAWVAQGASADYDFVAANAFRLGQIQNIATDITSARATPAGVLAAGSGAYAAVGPNALRFTADEILFEPAGIMVEAGTTNGLAVILVAI